MRVSRASLTLSALVAAALLTAVAPGPAGAECPLGRCADHTTVDLIRAEVAATCDCAGAESRKAYRKCVKGVVTAAVKEGRLAKVCKGPVRKCEKKTTCGRDGAVTCCEVKGNGRLKASIKKSAEKCGGNVCVGHVAAADACDPDGTCALLVRPFRNAQDIFTQSCALASCHSAATRQGGLVLSEEELSWASLVAQDPEHVDALALGLKLVDPGQPDNSFLIRKLRGQGPGDSMPQGAPPLDEAFIAMIEDWIARGALPTREECQAIETSETIITSGGVIHVSAEHGTSGGPVCDDRPIVGGSFE